MGHKNIIALAGALAAGSAAVAQPPGCPKWEAGTRYPWQSNTIVRGDQFAWLVLDVNRQGYPFRCKIRANNYPDNEARLWLCKQYLDRWRGPAATASDPEVRRLKRYSLVAGYDHHIADQKARPLWFNQHPEERPECYPEPSRPDRMDL